MSKEQQEPDGTEHMGILGRAMARARARSRAEGDEAQVEGEATRASHGARKGRNLEDLAAREFLGVVVGADGVLFQGRFIPHSEIRAVRLASSDQGGSRSGEGSEGATVRWWVHLHFTGSSDVLRLTRELETGRGAGAVHYLAYEIESALAAWAAARRKPAVDAGLLARGEQTAADWLKTLRRLGSSSSPYRAPLVDIEHVSRLLDEVRAKPWIRAAAATFLASSGDPTASERLRLSAAAMANPRTRTALSAVADASDDDEVAEALGALSAADGD